MLNQNEAQSFVGAKMVDSTGSKIGEIGQIYVDDHTGEPSWATVKTGLFGTKETFVPLDGAQSRDGELHVPFTTDQVKDAPRYDADAHLSQEEERELYAHYGRGDDYDRGVGYDRDRHGEYESGRDYRLDEDATGERAAAAGVAANAGANAKAGADVDVDRNRNRGQDELVAHEERLRVGTETRESGRARLRKVVTEQQESVSVPVRREELRVEREPIADGRVVDGDLDQIGEQEVELTLHEERPVVGKETVATERVRASTEIVEDEVAVSDTVRKEQIEVDGDPKTGRRKDV